LSAFRDDIAAFRKLDAEVLGVNSGSLKSHQNFSQKYGFNFPLLVDEDGRITRAFGADKEPKGTQRTVYIIDKDGSVRYAKRGMPPDEELLEVLESL
jgi:peroxiredoxin Q/BCP